MLGRVIVNLFNYILILKELQIEKHDQNVPQQYALFLPSLCGYLNNATLRSYTVGEKKYLVSNQRERPAIFIIGIHQL